MRVESSHHIDSSEPNSSGKFEWRYEYDLFTFTESALSLVARSYISEPEEAHFLRFEHQGKFLRGVESEDLTSPLVAAAIAHLRGIGKTTIQWLGSESYEIVP